MERNTQRKWALKFMYPTGVPQYAGKSWGKGDGYSGVGLNLTSATLFNSQQEALQDMMRTYGSNVCPDSVYPLPVPVIVETKTETIIYEAND